MRACCVSRRLIYDIEREMGLLDTSDEVAPSTSRQRRGSNASKPARGGAAARKPTAAQRRAAATARTYSSRPAQQAATRRRPRAQGSSQAASGRNMMLSGSGRGGIVGPGLDRKQARAAPRPRRDPNRGGVRAALIHNPAKPKARQPINVGRGEELQGYPDQSAPPRDRARAGKPAPRLSTTTSRRPSYGSRHGPVTRRAGSTASGSSGAVSHIRATSRTRPATGRTSSTATSTSNGRRPRPASGRAPPRNGVSWGRVQNGATGTARTLSTVSSAASYATPLTFVSDQRSGATARSRYATAEALQTSVRRSTTTTRVSGSYRSKASSQRVSGRRG